jgi:Right handed beta helix region
MISMIRAIAKLFVVAAAITTSLPVASSHAQNIEYVSATGTDSNSCTPTQPCADVQGALAHAGINSGNSAQVICLGGSAVNGVGFFLTDGVTVDVDCPQGSLPFITFEGGVVTVRFRHLNLGNTSVSAAITASSGGTIILEDCVFTGSTAAELDVEPNGPLNLVIRNSRISNSGSGILLKPAAGGSITATLDHVTIADNTGGGIKIDTTNGPVTLDVTDSVISSNASNGINAVGNAGGQTMASIKNSVIAKNGLVGVQVNGANAGVLLQTTLLDQNVGGATSVVNGGHISTYGNNSIVGSAGSGFTGTAPLQ